MFCRQAVPAYLQQAKEMGSREIGVLAGAPFSLSVVDDLLGDNAVMIRHGELLTRGFTSGSMQKLRHKGNRVWL